MCCNVPKALLTLHTAGGPESMALDEFSWSQSQSQTQQPDRGPDLAGPALPSVVTPAGLRRSSHPHPT